MKNLDQPPFLPESEPDFTMLQLTYFFFSLDCDKQEEEDKDEPKNFPKLLIFVKLFIIILNIQKS